MAPAADATSTRNDLVRETPPFHGVVRSKDGDYRWVAEVVSHVVFADPTNAEARELEARALEQLGYQAENGSWRNFFLMGGLELREGAKGTQVSATSPDMLGALSLEQLLAGIASPRRRDARRRGTPAGPQLGDRRRAGRHDAERRSPEHGDLSGIRIDGDVGAPGRLFALLDAPDRDFEIVVP